MPAHAPLTGGWPPASIAAQRQPTNSEGHEMSAGATPQRPALLGGEPAHPGPWPTWPVADAREREALLDVLESGKWWYGERVREFEEAFARFQGARFGITCVNGTAALELSLIAAGVGAGMEVIVPPYTFVATASAVLRVNAVPVFADIDLATLNLSPEAVEAATTERTAAIMPVHFAGLPADMDALGRHRRPRRVLLPGIQEHHRRRRRNRPYRRRGPRRHRPLAEQLRQGQGRSLVRTLHPRRQLPHDRVSSSDTPRPTLPPR